MKIFNISDNTNAEAAKELARRGLADQAFEVGGVLLAPGSSTTVDDSKRSLLAKQMKHLVKQGALAFDNVPQKYKAKPAKTQAAPAPAQPTAPSDAQAPAKAAKKGS